MPSTPVNLPALDDHVLEALGNGSYYAPHDVLGMHPLDSPARTRRHVVRTRRPLASHVDVVFADGTRTNLQHVAHGIWQAETDAKPQAYAIEACYGDAETWTSEEPYRFAPSIGELDIHLIAEGRHEELWRVLGAHFRGDWDTPGTSFAVWAPRARAVRVIGDFNNWDGTSHMMRSMGSTGIWELFIPRVTPGTTYKFEICTQDGAWVQRADPMAQYAEVAPATASRVFDSKYEWADSEWMTRRGTTDPHSGPMSVYELHLGSWRDGLDYRSAADALVEYVTHLGYTHVEFLPLAEHPYGPSWGYQVTGYFAASSRFGNPDDLRYLIDRLHQADIGVIMDWVPGHFPKDEWALARFDGAALYEHPDPRRGEQKDWGTLVFDFGNPRVRNFLVANALFWLEEFHVDGLRVDAVASMLYLDYSREEGEWLPNIYGGRENLEAISFLQEVTATAYKRNPGTVMIAEESTSWGGVTAPTSGGGLGFGIKWNMGWMHDSLEFIARDPMYRSYHHGEITFSFLYAYSENFILPISHDEVVHGKGSLLSKMPGDHWQQRANLRLYLAFMWAHPGKQLLFMGQEFGQLSEWREDRELDWWILDQQPSHRAIFDLVRTLNGLYRDTPALWALDNEPAGFEWVDGGEIDPNVISFLRFDTDGAPLLGIFNFGGSPRHDYRIGVPRAGRWVEVLNTDAENFGGSGVGNLGEVHAAAEPWSGREASMTLTVPPLGALWLRPATG